MLTSPSPSEASPMVMTARCPNRSTRCGAILDSGITMVAIGSRQSSAEQRAVAEDQLKELQAD